MRKITLILVCLMAAISTSFAQRAGDKSIGLNLDYASETSFGIGTRFQFNLTDNIRLEPEFNYHFKRHNISFWDLGANISYLLPVASDVTVYPLAGIGYMNAGVHADGTSEKYDDGSFQAKLGAGAEFKILPNAKLIIEPKYQFNDYKNQFIFTAGIAYCF